MLALLSHCLPRRTLVGAALLCAGCEPIEGDLLSRTNNPGAGEVAMQEVGTLPAYTFMEALGIFVHLDYTDTVYFSRYRDVVLPALRDLRVRHLRERAVVQESQAWLQTKYARLAEVASLGIHFQILMDPRTPVAPAHQSDVLGWMGESVLAFEGPIRGTIFRQTLTTSDVTAYAQELAAVRAGLPEAQRRPLVAPASREGEASGVMEPWVDFANADPVIEGGPPEPALQSALDRARMAAGEKPAIVTGVSYHAMGSGSAVPEPVAAAYTVRLLLDYADRGVKRVFFHQLMDPGTAGTPEATSGLLAADGRRRPVFSAWQNLASLLDDATPSAPATFRRALIGAEGVREVVLSKSDGTMVVALWQLVRLVEPGATTPADVAPRRIQVVFPEARSLSVHRPALQAEATQTIAATTSAFVDVHGDPTLLVIRSAVMGGS